MRKEKIIGHFLVQSEIFTKDWQWYVELKKIKWQIFRLGKLENFCHFIKNIVGRGNLGLFFFYFFQQ